MAHAIETRTPLGIRLFKMRSPVLVKKSCTPILLVVSIFSLRNRSVQAEAQLLLSLT
jgi:hypothetical protein